MWSFWHSQNGKNHIYTISDNDFVGLFGPVNVHLHCSHCSLVLPDILAINVWFMEYDSYHTLSITDLSKFDFYIFLQISGAELKMWDRSYDYQI